MKNPISLLRTNGQKKRRDLTSVVNEVVKESNGHEYDIQWFHGFLGKHLSIGSVNIHGDGNLLTLYTMNYVPRRDRENLESTYLDLPDFNSVDIQIPSGREFKCLDLPDTKPEYEKARKMAESISEKLKAKGYSVTIREAK